MRRQRELPDATGDNCAEAEIGRGPNTIKGENALGGGSRSESSTFIHTYKGLEKETKQEETQTDCNTVPVSLDI